MSFGFNIKAFIGIFILLFFFIGKYFYNINVELNKELITEKAISSREISLLLMKNKELEGLIEKQNKSIDNYKNNIEEYKKRVELKNNEIIQSHKNKENGINEMLKEDSSCESQIKIISKILSEF